MSQDLPSRLRWDGIGWRELDARRRYEQERDATASRMAPHWMKVADPTDPAAYDPYNTGAFRVLADQPRRRTLDDMRKLDSEIRRHFKPWR